MENIVPAPGVSLLQFMLVINIAGHRWIPFYMA